MLSGMIKNRKQRDTLIISLKQEIITYLSGSCILTPIISIQYKIIIRKLSIIVHNMYVYAIRTPDSLVNYIRYLETVHIVYTFHSSSEGSFQVHLFTW